MNKKGYYVNVYANKNQKENGFLKIRCQGFCTTIPTTFINQYNLTVREGNMFIQKEQFEEWFKNEIHAKEEEIRLEKERFNCFYPHIPLYWKNKDLILNNPRFYSVVTPNFFMGLAYYGGCRTITIGELLLIWEKEESFIFKCSCGGKSVCFQFGGSPLSGTEWVSKTICLVCDKIDNKGGMSSPLRVKIEARRKYTSILPLAENPVSYSELRKICMNVGENN
jgi:hypothetical protein